MDNEATQQELEIYEVSEKVLAYIKSFYEESRAYVRVVGHVRGCFSANNGLRQGCGKSP